MVTIKGEFSNVAADFVSYHEETPRQLFAHPVGKWLDLMEAAADTLIEPLDRIEELRDDNLWVTWVVYPDEGFVTIQRFTTEHFWTSTAVYNKALLDEAAAAKDDEHSLLTK
ncbi:MAG: hypothetical protein SGI73_06435 [Chloroflexota bacterium]|nr:hypothetical protein [Chloroflexota bacterium]